MLETPTLPEIRNNFQHDISFVNHAIESIRTMEGKKILFKQLTDRKQLKLC